VDAVKNVNEYKLDNQHTFRVNLLTDFVKYIETEMSGTFQRSSISKTWAICYQLEEAECRDQYSVIFESENQTSVF
jgi:translation initiation factor 3 subunit B